MMMYRSQQTYGPKGHLLCTPVCYALADAFLMGGDTNNDDNKGNRLDRCFAPARIDAAMRASHQFFEREDLHDPLMLLDMQKRFPMAHAGASRMFEVAGLTSGGPTQATENDAGTAPLILLPLDELVSCMRVCAGTHRIALLVTYGGHTVALLMDPSCTPHHGPWLFDPQASCLQLVDATTPLRVRQSLRLPDAAQEYAGLFLCGANALLGCA